MPDLQNYTFDFDDLVDAVQAVEGNGQSSVVNRQSTYDLQGRRLPDDSSAEGIVITKGKKVKK